ncbi:hypothetical protein [Halalkalibacter okhensis]|uniref:Uncharacterized protein n=1 Tax=Halalkalibacter okhensis TaxID=333138 RepID=A0A0B0IJN7_9BACI|nr:hypothetical protein [Halalkalibacter okhensis]KHF40269.1 hypothetical protein LQ50_09710 [Halalkalibacter okhensis]
MIKQLLLIFSAFAMFVTVWVFVLMQFNGKQGEEMFSVEVMYEEMEVEQNASREEQGDENEKNDLRQNNEWKESSLVKEIKEEVNETQVLNLRDFDFSDVSTPEGVPIQEILIKLKLD